VIPCYVSEALAQRKYSCLVKINSDLNKERENVTDTENGVRNDGEVQEEYEADEK
jgi:hypothetical protein